MSGRRAYALFGAAPNTSNRGVTALYRCVVDAVGGALPDSRLLVFDGGPGVRDEEAVLNNGSRYQLRRVGAHGGRRYYAPGNLATMARVSRLGSTVGGLHPVIRLLDNCDSILDVSGGDSFSDIYGSHRFWSVVRPKLIARHRSIPLFLLPQTYGPFVSEHKRGVAKEAVLAAEMAWARDSRSFQALQDLLGDDFDPRKHREGVDMAFALGVSDPGDKLSPTLAQWIAEKHDHPLIGLNISGLIALDPLASSRDFSLRANYMEALAGFVRAALTDPDVRLVVVPHVMSRLDSLHSDRAAGLRLVEMLPEALHERVIVGPRELDEREVKWLISQMDWFCGTRMHSTIAALSSGVPTATVPYSDKALGVFESCGLGGEVADPRRLDTQSVSDQLLASFHDRARIENDLLSNLPRVKAQAVDQLTLVTDAMAALGRT